MRRHAPLIAGLAILALAACSAGGARKGETVARELGQVKDRMDQVDCAIGKIQPARPITRTSARQWAAEVKKELRRYGPIRTDALALQEEAQEVENADVRRAADLLVRMIEQRDNEMTHFVRAVETWPKPPRGRNLRRATEAMLSTLFDSLAVESEEVKKTNEEWSEIGIPEREPEWAYPGQMVCPSDRGEAPI